MKNILWAIAWLSFAGSLVLAVTLFGISFGTTGRTTPLEIISLLGYVLSGFIAFALFGGIAEILERLERLEEDKQVNVRR